MEPCVLIFPVFISPIVWNMCEHKGERAFEGFEGDFERPEFQDAAHPR